MEWVAKHPIQDSHIPQPNGQVKKINRREYRVYSFGYGARELTCRPPCWPGIQSKFSEEHRTAREPQRVRC